MIAAIRRRKLLGLGTASVVAAPVTVNVAPSATVNSGRGLTASAVVNGVTSIGTTILGFGARITLLGLALWGVLLMGRLALSTLTGRTRAPKGLPAATPQPAAA
jgi:hypothetical protein